MSTTIDRSTLCILLAYFLIHVFTVERLTQFTQETLDTIAAELTGRYPEFDLTVNDCKTAWKVVIEMYIYGGTFINTALPKDTELKCLDIIQDDMEALIDAL